MVKGREEKNQRFNDIYAAFHPKICRYLSRLLGETEAEDVAQEVFLKVSAALGNFRGESSLSTWIYRIATNAATDHRRKAATALQEQVTEPRLTDDSYSEEESVEDPSVSLDRQLVRKEMNDCIKSIVDGLPENYRSVLVLSDLEELSNDEIADVLGISLETVKIRLHRARAKLKKELEHHCSFYKDERNELACDRKISPIKFLNR